MLIFPPVHQADENGLLAYGGNLEIETLRAAYRGGIFPWPVRGCPLLWFAPPLRGILEFNEFTVSRRLARTLRRAGFECRIDSDFEGVIRACAAPRAYENETWINADMVRAYLRLHQAGDAHSVETYRDGRLVGGLYGVACGAVFCGESMFHRESDASKAALMFLVDHLRERGASWLDVQLLTPFFAGFGAHEVPRREFMKKLRMALKAKATLFDATGSAPAATGRTAAGRPLVPALPGDDAVG